MSDTATKRACRRPDCSTSTSIDDITLTFGLGRLDPNGFWQEPCHACARAFERENPGKKAWPHPTEDAATMRRRRVAILVAEKVMGWTPFVSGDYEKWKALYDRAQFAVYLDNEERLCVSRTVHPDKEDIEEGIDDVEPSSDDWNPLENIKDAVEVLERLQKLGFFVVISTPLPDRTLWEVRGWKPAMNEDRFIAHGPSMPEAICFGALDAIGAKIPKESP